MMSNLNFVWIFLVFSIVPVFCADGDVPGFDFITYCRDNESRPVDWWYLYKPPARSFIERGRYFVYLTPFSEGRWESSTVYITAGSMLLNTLAPLYRKTFESHLAVIIYTERMGNKGSALMGILLADALGGIWISHTVPGLPDLTQDKPIFPEEEIENGHMITCMTLDYAALDEIIRVLYHAQPEFIHVKVPPQLVDQLPAWSLIKSPDVKFPGKTKVAEFVTRQQKLKPLLVVRKPADDRCLYKTFAKSRKIILDVYGDRDADHSRATCTKESGVRNIDAISLKFPNEVHYVSNLTDRAGFAISTAAHWQRTGVGRTQYWTCTGSPERPRGAGRGGMILCVEDYEIWVSFDKLKIKEPDC